MTMGCKATSCFPLANKMVILRHAFSALYYLWKARNKLLIHFSLVDKELMLRSDDFSSITDVHTCTCPMLPAFEFILGLWLCLRIFTPHLHYFSESCWIAKKCHRPSTTGKTMAVEHLACYSLITQIQPLSFPEQMMLQRARRSRFYRQWLSISNNYWISFTSSTFFVFPRLYQMAKTHCSNISRS